MNNYLVIKVETEAEYEKYCYIVKRFSIHTILWGAGKDVVDIIEELFLSVEPFCCWQLFVVDLFSISTSQNPYSSKQNMDFVTLSQEQTFVNGRGVCRPPDKIYFLRRREECVASGKQGEELLGYDKALPCCRFLVLEHSHKEYLEVYERLAMISLITILTKYDVFYDLLQAYHVYSVQVDINDFKLIQYLRKEKDILIQQEENLIKKMADLSKCEEKIEDGIQEYIPQFNVKAYEVSSLKALFCSVKTKKNSSKWLKIKTEIEVRIEEARNQQLNKQKELNKEVKHRLCFASPEDMFLEDETVKDIEKRILKMQTELNNCYVDMWELDTKLAERKKQKEQELDGELKNRYTWSELLGTAGVIFLIMIGGFGVFLFTEWKVVKEIEVTNMEELISWIWLNIRYMGGILLKYVLIYLGVLLLKMRLDIKKARDSFQDILDQIGKRIQENIFKYRSFFSLVYGLRICQSYLNRNKNFQIKRMTELNKLEMEKVILEKNREDFENLYSCFRHLEKNIDQNSERVEKNRIVRIKINSSGKEIESSLFYIEGLTIKKEVRNEG